MLYFGTVRQETETLQAEVQERGQETTCILNTPGAPKDKYYELNLSYNKHEEGYEVTDHLVCFGEVHNPQQMSQNVRIRECQVDHLRVLLHRLCIDYYFVKSARTLPAIKISEPSLV